MPFTLPRVTPFCHDRNTSSLPTEVRVDRGHGSQGGVASRRHAARLGPLSTPVRGLALRASYPAAMVPLSP